MTLLSSSTHGCPLGEESAVALLEVLTAVVGTDHQVGGIGSSWAAESSHGLLAHIVIGAWASSRGQNSTMGTSRLARHNHYLIKTPTDTGVRHDHPPTITIAKFTTAAA